MCGRRIKSERSTYGNLIKTKAHFPIKIKSVRREENEKGDLDHLFFFGVMKNEYSWSLIPERKERKRERENHVISFSGDQSVHSATNFPSQFIGCLIREEENREEVYIHCFESILIQRIRYFSISNSTFISHSSFVFT